MKYFKCIDNDGYEEHFNIGEIYDIEDEEYNKYDPIPSGFEFHLVDVTEQVLRKKKLDEIL